MPSAPHLLATSVVNLLLFKERRALTQAKNSSVETWKNNGEKNGGGALDYSDQDQADMLINNEAGPINVRAPGVIRIPVCSAEDAYNTWKEMEDWPDQKDMPESFPCP